MKVPFRSLNSFQDLFEIAKRSESTVLLSGPTGSGKTSLARRIHQSGARRDRPFVTINLASVHSGTIESELFGHERGAFTGADQRRIGKLESANGGTVFLDEIGEIPPTLQAKLLEFLQSKTISPVGSNREIRLNVRVIVATHKDLARAVCSRRISRGFVSQVARDSAEIERSRGAKRRVRRHRPSDARRSLRGIGPHGSSHFRSSCRAARAV